MPYDDEPDDEVGFVPPLPQDDRLWRHPSELRSRSEGNRSASHPTRSEAGARALHPASRGKRSTARVLSLVSVVLAVVAIGTVVATRSFDTPPSTSVATVRGATVVDLRTSDAARRVRSAVVQLRVDAPSGARSVTGLVIDPIGHVLTTSDALRDATAVKIVPVHGDSRPATIIGFDPADDIAVLSTDPDGLTPASLVTAADVPPGASTFVIGLTTDVEPIWVRDARLGSTLAKVDGASGQTFHDLLQLVVAGDPPTAAIVCSRDGAILGIITDRIVTSPTLRTSTPIGAPSSIGTPETTVYATPVAWMRTVVAQLLSTPPASH